MLKWGAEVEFSGILGTSFLISVSQISTTHYVACSARKMYIANRGKIVVALPYHFTACTYAKELDTVFGVSVGAPLISAFLRDQPETLIFRDFPLDQAFVHQIEYIVSRNYLITIGADIKIWRYTMPRVKRAAVGMVPMVFVSSMPSSPFCSMMNNAFVDVIRERILVPSSAGYALYSFDGNEIASVPNFAQLAFSCVTVLHPQGKSPVLKRNSRTIMYAFKRFFAVDSAGNPRIWGSTGHMLSAFANRGSMIFSRFITSEFVVLVDTVGVVSVLDVKTARWTIVGDVGRKPDHVFYFAETRRIVVVVGAMLQAFELSVIWRLWYRPLARPMLIQKHTCAEYSARFGVLSEDGSYSIFSTKSKPVLAVAATSTLLKPLCVCYDRSYKDNTIMFTMTDGSLHFFKSSGNDFVFNGIKNLRATRAFFVQGFDTNEWMVCSFDAGGSMILTHPEEERQYSRIVIGGRVEFAFWHRSASSIVALTARHLAILSLKPPALKTKIELKCPELAAFEEGALLLAYPNGLFMRFELDERGLTAVGETNFGVPIVSVSIRYGIHIIVTADQEVILGTKGQLLGNTISLPAELLCAYFLNVDLDLVVATERELMIVDGSMLSSSLEPLICDINDNDGSKNDWLIAIRRLDFVVSPAGLADIADLLEGGFGPYEADILWKIKMMIKEEELAEQELIEIGHRFTREEKTRKSVNARIRLRLRQLLGDSLEIIPQEVVAPVVEAPKAPRRKKPMVTMVAIKAPEADPNEKRSKTVAQMRRLHLDRQEDLPTEEASPEETDEVKESPEGEGQVDSKKRSKRDKSTRDHKRREVHRAIRDRPTGTVESGIIAAAENIDDQSTQDSRSPVKRTLKLMEDDVELQEEEKVTFDDFGFDGEGLEREASVEREEVLELELEPKPVTTKTRANKPRRMKAKNAVAAEGNSVDRPANKVVSKTVDTTVNKVTSRADDRVMDTMMDKVVNKEEDQESEMATKPRSPVPPNVSVDDPARASGRGAPRRGQGKQKSQQNVPEVGKDPGFVQYREIPTIKPEDLHIDSSSESDEEKHETEEEKPGKKSVKAKITRVKTARRKGKSPPKLDVRKGFLANYDADLAASRPKPAPEPKTARLPKRPFVLFTKHPEPSSKPVIEPRFFPADGARRPLVMPEDLVLMHDPDEVYIKIEGMSGSLSKTGPIFRPIATARHRHEGAYAHSNDLLTTLPRLQAIPSLKRTPDY